MKKNSSILNPIIFLKVGGFFFEWANVSPDAEAGGLLGLS